MERLLKIFSRDGFLGLRKKRSGRSSLKEMTPKPSWQKKPKEALSDRNCSLTTSSYLVTHIRQIVAHKLLNGSDAATDDNLPKDGLIL